METHDNCWYRVGLRWGLTPFGGIGSEAYTALKFGRKATLIELKPEYFNVAVQNMKKAESLSTRKDLFSKES